MNLNWSHILNPKVPLSDHANNGCENDGMAYQHSETPRLAAMDSFEKYFVA